MAIAHLPAALEQGHLKQDLVPFKLLLTSKARMYLLKTLATADNGQDTDG